MNIKKKLNRYENDIHTNIGKANLSKNIQKSQSNNKNKPNNKKNETTNKTYKLLKKNNDDSTSPELLKKLKRNREQGLLR